MAIDLEVIKEQPGIFRLTTKESQMAVVSIEIVCGKNDIEIIENGEQITLKLITEGMRNKCAVVPIKEHQKEEPTLLSLNEIAEILSRKMEKPVSRWKVSGVLDATGTLPNRIDRAKRGGRPRYLFSLEEVLAAFRKFEDGRSQRNKLAAQKRMDTIARKVMAIQG